MSDGLFHAFSEDVAAVRHPGSGGGSGFFGVGDWLVLLLVAALVLSYPTAAMRLWEREYGMAVVALGVLCGRVPVCRDGSRPWQTPGTRQWAVTS